jgi:hypothetical protein
MKLNIELELVADYHEDDNDRVTLTSLSFPDCSQNLMVFMSPEKIEEAQQALIEAVQDAAIYKVEQLLEQRGARLGQYRSPRTGE